MLKNSSLLIYSIIRNLEKNIYGMKKIGREKTDFEKNLYKYIEKMSTPRIRKERKALTGKIKTRNEQLEKISSEFFDLEKIYKKIHVFGLNRSRSAFKSAVSRIYNEIENGFYDHSQLILCYIHEALFEEDYLVDISKLNRTSIKKILKLYSEKQLELDKQFILNINQKLDLKIRDFFKINSDGESIVFNLIKKKYIHPNFYLYFSKKLLTRKPENINLVTVDYLQFWRLCEIIKKNHKNIIFK